MTEAEDRDEPTGETNFEYAARSRVAYRSICDHLKIDWPIWLCGEGAIDEEDECDLLAQIAAAMRELNARATAV